MHFSVNIKAVLGARAYIYITRQFPMARAEVAEFVPPVPSQVLSRWEDLEKVGFSKSSFHEKYRDIYGQEPDYVCVNEGMCLEYGHYCYIVQECCSYSNQQQAAVMSTGESKELVNTMDKPVTFRVELKSEHTVSATLTVTQASAFSLKNKISVHSSELGIADTLSTKFSFHNDKGSTCCVSEAIEVADIVNVTLQPGQKAIACQDISWTETKHQFTIPFEIAGWCMARFPNLVNGQHYWLHDIASLFHTPTSSLHGTIDCVGNVTSSVYVNLV